MLWWVAAILTWVFSAVGIIAIMAGVTRGKERFFSGGTMIGVGIHGATAVLVVFFLFKALAGCMRGGFNREILYQFRRNAMNKVLWAAGILLMIAGLAGIAALLGEVFSQNDGFTSCSSQIWGYLIFHTLTMGGGMFALERAVRNRRATVLKAA